MQFCRSSYARKTLAQTVCYCLLVHVATPTIVDVDDDACLLAVYKLETLTFRHLLFLGFGLSWEQLTRLQQQIYHVLLQISW